MKSCKAPEHIRLKAECLIQKYRNHKIKPRRTYRRRYMSIKVTPGWRLMSMDDGKTWMLLTHANYDKLI